MKVNQVIARYGITPARINPIEQGSTNKSLVIESASGTFFLRYYTKPQESLWNRIICTKETVQYEHDVLRYAFENGIPCVPPMENRAGETITELDGNLYALFPYIETQPYRPARPVMGIREAELLGRYHTVMENYPVRQQRPGWGYAGQLRAWFHENQVDIGTLDELLTWVDTLEPIDETHAYVRQNASCIHALIELLEDGFRQDLYRDCSVIVNHGDFIPRNIGAAENGLVLFDFDSCVRDLRIYDLAMLLGYTAGEPHTGRNIDAQIAHNIVRSYRQVAPMTDEELGLTLYMLIAFRLRLFMGNLGILRTTSSYRMELIRRNLEGLCWLLEYRQAITEMLVGQGARSPAPRVRDTCDDYPRACPAAHS